MAFTQKSSSTIQRVEGDLPPIPEAAGIDLREWWSEATAVLDRVRDKIDDIDATTTSSTGLVSSENTKLSGIEAGATGDQTAVEIKSLYESNSNTNTFTDEHLSNLESLEASDREIGKQSGGGSSERYLFTATTNQARWIINHQLGFLPVVQVYNSALEEVYADIQHTDNYETIIDFSGTTTGYAVLS
jgi:hypothetical protein